MDYSRLSRETLIHEVKKLNKELEIERMKAYSSEMNMSNLFDSVDFPVYSVSTNYEVKWANTYTLEHFEGYNFFKCYQVFFGRNDICPNCHLNTIVDSGQLNRLQILDKGDTVQIIQLPMNKSPNQRGVIEYHYQLTEGPNEKEKLRVSLKEAQILSDSLKTTLENEREFVRTLIKIIRTPLRALNGFFQIDPQLRPQYLDTLKNTSHQVYELLHKLTFFDVKDTYKNDAKLEPMSLKKMIELAANQARLNSYYKSIEQQIVVSMASTIPEVLIGDAFKVQILLTYLFEWILFSEACSKVYCDVTDIIQTPESIHIGVVLKTEPISDYGINEFTLSPMARYSAKMGMDIVTKMVELLDFKMEISQGISGERVLELIGRFDKVVSVNNPVETHSTEEVKRKRILIADYEKPNIGIDFFENYEIYFAKTGLEAIRIYFEVEPELTILNVSIEDCDGFEVFDEIQRKRRYHRPIIATSNQLIDAEESFMKNYGFDAYYPKPIEAMSFKEIIDRHIS